MVDTLIFSDMKSLKKKIVLFSRFNIFVYKRVTSRH